VVGFLIPCDGPTWACYNKFNQHLFSLLQRKWTHELNDFISALELEDKTIYHKEMQQDREMKPGNILVFAHRSVCLSILSLRRHAMPCRNAMPDTQIKANPSIHLISPSASNPTDSVLVPMPKLSGSGSGPAMRTPQHWPSSWGSSSRSSSRCFLSASAPEKKGFGKREERMGTYV